MGALSRQLTDRQEAFIAYYLGEANMNGTRAAELAGYAHPNVTAHHDLLVNPSIKSRIQEALKARGMGVEEVVSRLSDIARASVEDLYDIGEDGTPKVNLKKARDRGMLHLVAGIKQTPFGPEVRLHNSLEALEKLGKVHRLFGEELPAEKYAHLTEQEATDRMASLLVKAAERLREKRESADSSIDADFVAR